MADKLGRPTSGEPTDLNELLRNLSSLVKMKDERIAYLASEGVQSLIALRRAAALIGFVNWNLSKKEPLAISSDLRLSYERFLRTLGTLAEALQSVQNRQSLDPQIALPASRIQEAWETLSQRRAAVA